MTRDAPQTTARARVSIGLPVYNGSRYIEGCIDSILKQSYRDFELVVVDNASTDDTVAIVRRFVERDPRISLHVNETNIGAPRNFNRAFELSRGELFKWAAYDDLLEPDLIARFVEALDANPAAVLCSSHARIIDDDGEEISSYELPLVRLSDEDPATRFADVVLTPSKCVPIYGLIRAEILTQTPLIGAYLGSDRHLLAELVLHGPFEILPESLTVLRKHSDQSTKLPRHERARRWFGQGRVVYPYWRKAWEYAASVGRAGLTPSDRARCYGVVARWVVRHWRYLRGDLWIAVRSLWRHRANA